MERKKLKSDTAAEWKSVLLTTADKANKNNTNNKRDLLVLLIKQSDSFHTSSLSMKNWGEALEWGKTWLWDEFVPTAQKQTLLKLQLRGEKAQAQEYTDWSLHVKINDAANSSSPIVIPPSPAPTAPMGPEAQTPKSTSSIWAKKKTSNRTRAWRCRSDVHGQHLFPSRAELPYNHRRIGFVTRRPRGRSQVLTWNHADAVSFLQGRKLNRKINVLRVTLARARAVM